MRIDKFLKVSRIIKRRTVAQEACDSSRITVNGKPAKPAKDVNVGDVVSVLFGDNTVTFRIKSIKETVKRDEVDEMYEILNG